LEKRFIAVGHISLNKEYESPGHAEPAEGLYWVANFYISAALQFMGLGRAAMDAVESMAISEPLCVKTLALSTVAMNMKPGMKGGRHWREIHQRLVQRRELEVYVLTRVDSEPGLV
jgi:hypothetical protein